MRASRRFFSRTRTLASERGAELAVLQTYHLAITKVRRIAQQLSDISPRYSAGTTESRSSKKI